MTEYYIDKGVGGGTVRVVNIGLNGVLKIRVLLDPLGRQGLL
jgi:hypothetical protein